MDAPLLWLQADPFAAGYGSNDETRLPPGSVLLEFGGTWGAWEWDAVANVAHAGDPLDYAFEA